MHSSEKNRVFLRILISLFFIFLLFPSIFYTPVQEGLDNSWNIAFGLAYKYHLRFGKDIIFTYGPLGFLNIRMPIIISRFIFLIFDIYFVFILLVIFREIFKRHFGVGTIVFIFLNVILAQYSSTYQWYFYFFFFFIFSLIREPHRKSLIAHAVLLSVISFYYKVSLGMSTVVIFLIVIACLFILKKWNLKWAAAVTLSYFLSICIGAFILHVNLPGYISGSLLFIDGYNDAMFRVMDENLFIYLKAAIVILLLLAAIGLFSLFIWIRQKSFVRNLDTILIYALTCMGIYIIFKSSFVRSDTHIIVFFQCISLFSAFFYLFGPKDATKNFIVCICWVTLGLSCWVVNTVPNGYKPLERVITLQFLTLKVGEVKNYIYQLSHYNDELARSDRQGKGDNEYKKLIGNHTVDIIPSEISTIFFNGLIYNPAPVIQSYAAYNERLDDLNRKKYSSSNAPDFILFSVGGIDERYSFFDETRTKMAILGNYDLFGKIHDDLLLRRRKIPADLIRVSEPDTLSVKMGEEILIKNSNDIQFSKIFVNNNLAGRIRRLFYQPPLLKIHLTLENNEEKTFQAVVPILAGGVILNKFISQTEDFQLFMQSYGRLGVNIRKVRFESSDTTSFVPEIKIINTYYRFPDRNFSDRISDSLGLVKLLGDLNGFRPTLINAGEYKNDSLLYGFGNISSYGYFVSLDGWAFREKSDNRDNLLSIVLKSGDKIYSIPTFKKERPDVQVAYQRPDVSGSGFVARVSKLQMPPGDYQIGFAVHDTVKKDKWIQYTDRHVIIHSQYALEKVNNPIYYSKGANSMEYGLSITPSDETKTLIDGWAFEKNGDSAYTETNLLLKNGLEIYKVNTDVKMRPDVVSHFKRQSILNCGFYAEITNDKIPAGIYSVGIEKVSRDGKQRMFEYTDQKLNIGNPGSFVPVLLPNPPPVGEFSVGYDFIRDGKDSFSVSGWAIRKMASVKDSRIDIILRNEKTVYMCSTEHRSRPDVTAAFKSKISLDDCGFFANISKKELKPGKYEVGVRVSQPGSTGVVTYSGQFVIKR